MLAVDAAADRLSILSIAECDRIAERVHELRPFWTSRSDEAPFFTLGAASYLDASPRGDTRYRALASEMNPVLLDAFGPLYDAFREAVEERVGEPVIYDETIAMPGFHIFLAHEVWGRGVASIHADRQYENVDWSAYIGEGKVDGPRQLSITLSIDLPASGGGLRLWDVNSLDVPNMTREERKAVLARNKLPRFLPYERGKAVIHTGHLFHQIAPMKDMREGEQRLTLQAHAIPTPRGWVLYW